jgi:hypothetical protein
LNPSASPIRAHYAPNYYAAFVFDPAVRWTHSVCECWATTRIYVLSTVPLTCPRRSEGLVRSVLVPAAMQLLGERNWYLPSWLQWLPQLDVEGHAEQAPRDVPGAPAETRPGPAG